jgi:Cu/Ag efflux protein CusF
MRMRKKRTALILASTFGLSTLALAGPQTKKPAAKSAESTCAGEVVAIRSMQNELTVKTMEHSKPVEKTFAVEATTVIRAQGKSIHLGDLKSGEKVSVRYQNSGGKLLARTIEVQHR